MSRTPVREAMTLLARMRIVAPETPVMEVLQAMEREDVNQVPVMKKGSLLGMVTREHLLRCSRRVWNSERVKWSALSAGRCWNHRWRTKSMKRPKVGTCRFSMSVPVTRVRR